MFVAVWVAVFVLHELYYSYLHFLPFDHIHYLKTTRKDPSVFFWAGNPRVNNQFTILQHHSQMVQHVYVVGDQEGGRVAHTHPVLCHSVGAWWRVGPCMQHCAYWACCCVCCSNWWRSQCMGIHLLQPLSLVHLPQAAIPLPLPLPVPFPFHLAHLLFPCTGLKWSCEVCSVVHLSSLFSYSGRLCVCMAWLWAWVACVCSSGLYKIGGRWGVGYGLRERDCVGCTCATTVMTTSQLKWGWECGICCI